MNKRKHLKYEDFLNEELQDITLATEYLNEAVKDEDPRMFLLALKNVLHARGESMTDFAQEVDIARQNLYKILSDKGNPRWENLRSIIHEAGFTISLIPRT